MVDLVQINTTCKSMIFKSVLTDLIYSFRASVKKLTGSVADVKLDQIRPRPIRIDGKVVVGKIRNLVGGRITCAFDASMVEFLNTESEYTSDKYSPVEMFAIDLFDCFSTTSKSGMLELNTNNVELSDTQYTDSLYYIRFDTRIFTKDGRVIPSRFIVSVDEITSMYFRDYP